MAEPNLVIQSFSEVVVVNFADASILEGPTIEALGTRLYELTDAQAQRKIVLDFSRVRLLSSSMLGVLVKLQKKSRAINGQVVLCGLRPELMKVFKITSLDKILTFAENEEKALNSFGVFTRP